MIWKRETTIEYLNHIGQNNMMSHLGIELTCLGDDYLEGTMPVDHRTKQPLGLLHGGASVVLAETLGSVAGYLCTEGEQKNCWTRNQCESYSFSERRQGKRRM